MNSNSSSKQPSKPKRRIGSNFLYDFVKITGAIPALIWIRPRVIHIGQKCPKGGVLISSNHPTLRDPITVLISFPWRRLHSLATKDLFVTPLKRFFFTRMHCIEVDKDNFNMASFHAVVDRLKEGKAVFIFPEGQVNQGDAGEVQAFKSGAILMAHRASVPIVPVYIVKREKWYRAQYVIIGEPFDVKAAVGLIPSVDKMNAVSEQLREKELELKRYYEENYRK